TLQAAETPAKGSAQEAAERAAAGAEGEAERLVPQRRGLVVKSDRRGPRRRRGRLDVRRGMSQSVFFLSLKLHSLVYITLVPKRGLNQD
ncbi:hypothetical protein E2320_013076, partial [Naja naja]